MARRKSAIKSPARSRPAPAVRRSRGPLRVLGTSVTQTRAIKQAAAEDLGLAFDFITRDGTEAQRQGALRPDTFDVYDQWFHDIDLIWSTGSVQPIDITRITRWEEINDLPKTGRLRADLPRPLGGDPSKRLFVQLDGSLGDAPSARISMVPTAHNADSFAVIGCDPATVGSWGVLLDPDWSGRIILQRDAAIGCLDMLLAMQARGELLGADLGDLSLEEIRALTERLRELVQRGHFRCVWADEAEAVLAMQAAAQSGTPMLGSMWWSGLTRLRASGTPVSMVTPAEGYRGWFGGLALSALVGDWARDAAYDFINWWLDGRPGAMMARSGAYIANPDPVRRYLSTDEWGFWYEGKPAHADIRDQDGSVIYRSGDRREGGDYVQRMSRVRVWDTVMNEHNYLVRLWESALAESQRRFREPVVAGSPGSPAPERPISP